jgi:hypothetical protein
MQMLNYDHFEAYQLKHEAMTICLMSIYQMTIDQVKF